jgi:hypothetical protein
MVRDEIGAPEMRQNGPQGFQADEQGSRKPCEINTPRRIDDAHVESGVRVEILGKREEMTRATPHRWWQRTDQQDRGLQRAEATM